HAADAAGISRSGRRLVDGAVQRSIPAEAWADGAGGRFVRLPANARRAVGGRSGDGPDAVDTERRFDAQPALWRRRLRVSGGGWHGRNDGGQPGIAGVRRGVGESARFFGALSE